MGGMPNGTSANSVGQKPRPRPSAKDTGSASASSASEGSARPTLAALIATNEKRPVWPSHNPSGSASRMANAVDRPDSSRCSATRVGMPLEPLQCAPSPNQAATDSRKATRSRPRSAARPRRRQPFDQHEQPIHHDCEDNGQAGPD